MKKDIKVTAEITFTIAADKDHEDEYNDKIKMITSGMEEMLCSVGIDNVEVEVICEDGTEDLFLTQDITSGE